MYTSKLQQIRPTQSVQFCLVSPASPSLIQMCSIKPLRFCDRDSLALKKSNKGKIRLMAKIMGGERETRHCHFCNGEKKASIRGKKHKTASYILCMCVIVKESKVRI